MTIKVDTIPVLPDVLYLVQFPAGNNSAVKTKKFIESIAPHFDVLRSKGSDVTFIGYNTDGPINIVVNTDSHDVKADEPLADSTAYKDAGTKQQWDEFVSKEFADYYVTDAVNVLLENQYKWYEQLVSVGKPMIDWRIIASLAVYIIKNSRIFKDLPIFPMRGPIDVVGQKAIEAKTVQLLAAWNMERPQDCAAYYGDRFDPNYFIGLAQELTAEYDDLCDHLSVFCPYILIMPTEAIINTTTGEPTIRFMMRYGSINKI